MAVSYEPIKAVRVLGTSNGMPAVLRVPEDELQTFKIGSLIAVVSGYAQIVASGFGGSELVYGVSMEAGHNLAVDGTAEDGYNEGAPQNQPSGKRIPPGAWIKDGKVGVYLANGQTIFSAMLKDGQVFTQALVLPATRYELEYDSSSGYWFIDTSDTGTSAKHAALIIGLDSASPNTAAAGARVFFQFAPAARAWD